MELRGEERESAMAMLLSNSGPQPDPESASFSKLPSASTMEARRRNEAGPENPTIILSPSSLDNLHLVKQAQTQAGRNLDPDPDTDPAPPGFPGNTSAPAPPQQLQASPQSPAQQAAAESIRYRECLKNHAASMGGHVVDGCGEFMPGGEDGTEEALKCAACDCHRNFHRKEIDGEPNTIYYPHNSTRNGRLINPQPHHHQHTHTPPPSLPAPHPPLPPPPQSQPHQRYHHNYHHAGPIPPIMMAFGGGAPAESSSEDLNMQHSGGGGQFMSQPECSPTKKRFRTRFTPEQKEKMQELAEKLGWKIQKQDEHEVQKFCSESGVKRQVFKVWMHNNKQAMKKKQQS